MADTGFQRFGLAGLARATQHSLDWKNWAPGAKPRELDQAGPSKEVLDRLIEAEIIPRLMLINREAADGSAMDGEGSVPAQARPGSMRIQPGDVDRFARRAATGDADDLINEVHRILRNGVTHEDVLLKLLAPAARRLGELWDEDVCDFADVTIGLMKLHRVLEAVNAETPCGLGAGGVSPRVLLSPAPGEQHVFGVVMVGEFFARSGWRVRCESSPRSDHLALAVSEDHYDVIGLSASSEVNVKALRAAIKLVRNRSLNRDVVILVGGQMFNEDPGLARRVGADASATDGVRAVVTAERLVQRLARAG